MWAQLDEIAAALDAATADRDEKATALAAVEAEVAEFGAKVASQGLADLTEIETYEVLVLLGITQVRPQVLVRQEINGAVLADMTEAEMLGVFQPGVRSSPTCSPRHRTTWRR